MTAERTLKPNARLTNVTGGKQTRYIDAQNEATGLILEGFKLNNRRGAIRIAGNAHDIVIRNGVVFGKGPQSGSDLPVGIEFRGTVHDALVENVEAYGFTMKPDGGYTNGDGMSDERGTKRITWRLCKSHDNSDGGYDCKGTEHLFDQCDAWNNYRNYRIWGSGHLLNCRIGPARNAGIWVGDLSGDLLITNPEFYGAQTHLRIEGGKGHSVHIVGGTIDGKPITKLSDLKIVRSQSKGAALSWEPAK